MYSNDKCKVKVGRNLSEVLSPTQGVRQGCILSPLLFNIFLSDLPTTLKLAEYLSPIVEDSRELSCILWADNLILLSETEEGLTKMLSKLSLYSKHNSLETNDDNKNCLIFNKTGKLIRRTFEFADISFETQ